MKTDAMIRALDAYKAEFPRKSEHPFYEITRAAIADEFWKELVEIEEGKRPDTPLSRVDAILAWLKRYP